VSPLSQRQGHWNITYIDTLFACTSQKLFLRGGLTEQVGTESSFWQNCSGTKWNSTWFLDDKNIKPLFVFLFDLVVGITDLLFHRSIVSNWGHISPYFVLGGDAI
jgi:hypothetical protein